MTDATCKTPRTILAGKARLLTVSRSVQIVAVLVVVVIGGFTAQQQLQSRATTLHAADRQMWRLDMVLAEQTGRAVETVDFILRGVIDQVQAGGADQLLNQAQLARRITGVRQLLAIDVSDEHGRILYSSRPAPGMFLPPAGLAAIERHVQDPSPAMQISEPIRDAAGRWIALLTRRINGPTNSLGNNFRGIAVASINLAYFDEFYKAVELNENGAILLHRRDGVVLTRYPFDERLEGTSYADLPPFRDVLSHDIAGTVEMDSPVDGNRRILAIRALRAFPLAVNISVSQSAVLADWRRQTWVYGVFAAILALSVSLLLFQLASRTREVERLLRDSSLARDSAEQANRNLMVEMEERARAEAALRKAQRVEAVGQLTGGVAHDFNNLLTVVLGSIDLLEDSLGPGPHLARLEAIRAAAERGSRLTGQLLAFARQQPMQPRAVNINALIHDMTPLLNSAVGTSVEITQSLNTDLCMALADPTQIELVILNLVINARDAMPMGGVIRISTEPTTVTAASALEDLRPGSYASIEVSDTGTGMSEDVLARAFEPFFTTKPPGIGSGLGLSQVYGVVRQLGGVARIASTPALGTTVTFLLPCAPAASAAPVRSSAAEGPLASAGGGRAHLLVVDDDGDVRATTAALLRNMGYNVTEAGGVDQAVSMITGGKAIDLVLTDVVMPGQSGTDLARRTKVLRPELPVVFVSGYSDPSAIGGAIPLDRLLRKPFRASELNAIIETALADA